MAGNTGIEQGLIALGETINGALTPQVESATQALTEAVAGLGEGLKITEKGGEKETSSLDVKKEEPEEQETKELLEKENQVVEELQGLQAMCPEMANIATQLIGANTTLNNLNEIESQESEESKKPLENGGILTDSKDPKDIGKGKTLAEICGTGLAITGNFLKDISEMLFKLVDTACAGSGGLQVVIIDANKSKGEKTEKGKSKGEKTGDSKGKLKSFFAGLAGPLESIAGSLLMLSLCMVILSSISFDSGLIKTLIAFQAFFLVTFAVLGVISLLYLKIGKKYMKEPKEGEENKDGSILGIVKEFAKMIFLVAGTIVVAFLLSGIIEQYWWPITKTLLFIFGAMFVMLLGLSLLCLIMRPLTGKDSPIGKTILSIAGTIFLIAVLAIFCWLFEDLIWLGMGSVMKIFGIVALMMITLSVLLLITSKVKPKAIENFTGLLMKVIILIALVSVLAIILGLLPESIINSGIIRVGLIMLLVAGLIIGIGFAISLLQKVSEKKIKALMAILIVTTVMLLLVGVLVAVLGNMPTGVIVQGLISIAVIFALIIGLVLILGKLATTIASNAIQALIALAVLSIFIIAVAGIAWLLTKMLGGLSFEQVLVTGLAIVLTIGVLLLVGVGMAALAMASPLLVGAAIPAAIGLGILALFAAGVAGVAAGVTAIFNQVKGGPEAVLVSVNAILITVMALLLMVPLVFLLAVSAIPLVFAVKLAQKALGTLNKFMFGLVVSMLVLSSAVNLLQAVDLTFFQTGILAILKIVGLLITMVVPFTLFAVVGIVLAALVAISAASITIIAVGMKIMVWAFGSLRKTLTLMPKDINLVPVAKAVAELSALAPIINAFQAPSVKQMLAVELSIGFYREMIRGLRKLGTDGIASNIKDVAQSLAALSGQADPLNKLGESLERVARATRAINSYEQENGGVAEILGLTKHLETSSTILERIMEPESESKDPYLEKLDTIINSLDSVLSSFGDVIYSLREGNDLTRLDSISTAPTTTDSPSFVGV